MSSTTGQDGVPGAQARQTPQAGQSSGAGQGPQSAPREQTGRPPSVVPGASPAPPPPPAPAPASPAPAAPAPAPPAPTVLARQVLVLPRVATRLLTPVLLSVALMVVTAVAAALTFSGQDVLHGTTVMNGSARGTALVLLVLGVPTVLLSMTAAVRGSADAVVVWLGALSYVLYNALMLLFATPLNRLFLLYVAMLGLAGWSIGTLLSRVDAPAFGARCSPHLPARPIAAFVWLVVTLNAVGWLSSIVPAIHQVGQPNFLRGTGLTTNPVFIQDLALWLPLMAVAAAWLWQGRPWGVLLVGAGLTMWTLESVSIAVDQWFGHAADPTSDVASLTVVPVFVAIALLQLAVLLVLFRGLYSHRGPREPRPRLPAQRPGTR